MSGSGRVPEEVLAGIRRICLASREAVGQQSLLATGHPFFLPRFARPRGWIGIEIDQATDWQEIAELVEDSNCEIAPRRHVAGFEA